MKSSIGAGAVAGLIGGIVAVIVGFISSSIGLYEPPPGPITNTIATMIILTIIIGAILGMLYSRLYVSIPGKAILKGIYFGLILWLISIINGAYILLVMVEKSISIRLIFVGFFIIIVYGPVLGTLYKK
ncbi:hypothetical protein [[Eubacterium] cellulosolvens]